MSNEVFAYFKTINHTNTLSVSSYALPFCVFKFILNFSGIEDLGILSNKQILWDYGDGTTGTSLTGIHAYSLPGTYQVTCYLFDENGNPYLNTYSRNVIVYNYITDQISLSTVNTTQYVLTAGRISYPILVSRTNSYQTYNDNAKYTIVPFASGANLTQSYFDSASGLLYGHLEKYNSFYIEQETPSGNIELVETDKIETPSTKIYCKLVNGQVIRSTENDPLAVFCGVSGERVVYFKEDVPQLVKLYFGFDDSTFDLNTSTIGLSCVVEPNTNYNSLSITSNGIDGEGNLLSSFLLTSDKFKDQKIHFVTKVKDKDWYTIKDISITNCINVLSSDTGIINSTFYIQSSSNGCIKGYVIPHDTGENAFIYSGITLQSPTISSYPLSGSSNKFNIIDTVDKLAKKGEDIDMLDKYKSLRFQELFLNKINLFDNFLGTIVGTLSSDQNSLGKKVYEKITNFVDNTSNIEKCEVAQLVSILQSVGEQNIRFEKVNFNFPVALKRLVDLLSIKHSKLFGARNTFDLDFYNYGNQLLGNNLGSKISNTLTYTVSAGNDLVALEKYSSTFKKLNTFIPLSAASLSGNYISTYPLSAYNHDWGWYLILNDDFQPEDIDKYYIFFNHNAYQNDIEDSVINFDDPNTTIQHSASSYTEWTRDNGTIDKLISYELALGLGLISSLSA